jgi:chitodextrinase
VGVTGYNIYRGGTKIGSSATTSYTDNTVAASTSYSYTVAAYDAAGNVSGQSGADNVTTPASTDTTAPSVPTGLTAGTTTSSSIPLSWTASTDNVGVTGYNIYRGGTKIGTSTTTSYVDNTVAAATSYSYTVAAYDAAGNLSGQSTSVSATTLGNTSQACTGAAFSQANCNTYVSGTKVNSNNHNYTCSNGNCANCAVSSQCFPGVSGCPWGNVWTDNGVCGSSTDTTAPTVPTNLASGTVTQTSVALSWTASTDNVGVAGYKIFRNSAQIATSTSTSYTDTTAVASTAYTYQVAAYDAAGNTSGLTAAISVTTQAPVTDTQPPTVPGGLTAGTITASSVAFSWTASTDNVGVTGYKVFRGGSQLGTSTTTSFTDTTASPSTTYSYTVSAYDAAGNNSAQSSPLSATTIASSSTCAAAYVQSSCNTLPYVTGVKVSNAGHNYTCANNNCENCAVDSRCGPGGTGCPWGDSNWTDNGTCK